MSPQKVDLALAFLQLQPASAAAVLEQQSAEQVAAFLHNISHIQAAAVLKRMLPRYSASVCRELQPAVAARLLSEMDIGLVASILRHSDDSLTKEMLGHLPERIKIACKLLLHFPEEAVGAWMVTNIVTLPDDCSAQEARARLTSAQDVIEIDTIHVADRERKLRGVIGVTELLRAAPETPIVSIMKKNPGAISGRAALLSAVKHPVWAHRDAVAVINRSHHMIGILRHVDLRRGLDRISNTISESSSGSPLSGICEAYGTSLLALMTTVGEVVDPRRSSGESR